jgi:hypothetical protein
MAGGVLVGELGKLTCVGHRLGELTRGAPQSVRAAFHGLALSRNRVG